MSRRALSAWIEVLKLLIGRVRSRIVLRPWRRLRRLERKLAAIELVVDALHPPTRGSRPTAKTVLRADLLTLAKSSLFLGDQDEDVIANGACRVSIRRKAAA